MAHFLAKTDPETYSIDDLKKDGTTEWDGVRNASAVGFIKTMRPGDTVNAAPGPATIPRRHLITG